MFVKNYVMKQTALQWFIEQIENHNGVTRAGFQKCIDEALQMENEQLKSAYQRGKKYKKPLKDSNPIKFN